MKPRVFIFLRCGPPNGLALFFYCFSSSRILASEVFARKVDVVAGGGLLKFLVYVMTITRRNIFNDPRAQSDAANLTIHGCNSTIHGPTNTVRKGSAAKYILEAYVRKGSASFRCKRRCKKMPKKVYEGADLRGTRKRGPKPQKTRLLGP